MDMGQPEAMRQALGLASVTGDGKWARDRCSS